jgi:hypothetical protein
MAATPGEFELEQELEPAHVTAQTVIESAPIAQSPRPAADDLASRRDADSDATLRAGAARIGPGLFDAGEDRTDVVIADAKTEETVPAFAHDFIEKQAAEAEIRWPLEAVPENAPPFAREEGPTFGAASAAPLHEPRGEGRMFGAHPEPDLSEAADSARPAILPYAVTAVVCLLAGFAPGYFIGSRERTPVSTEASVTTPASQPAGTAGSAPTGAATSDQPGQYSEQKVTPQPAREAPPVPTEGVRAPARSTSAAAAAAARPVATTGRLVVKSTPSRAGVTVNGTWRGRTPLTLDNLAFGKYRVRVVQPGFLPAHEDVTLNAGTTAHTVDTKLVAEERAAPAPRAAAPSPSTPASFTGSIFVDSRPRGATVLIDGKSVGQTPLSVPAIPVGSHVVRIEMAGKKPWSSPTRVTAGETARVTGSLEDRQ